MLGWMVIFSFMVLLGTMSAFAGGIGAFVLTSSLVFGLLLSVSALTFILRGRA